MGSEEIDTVVELYESGMSCREVGRRMEMSPQQVHSHLKREGTKIRTRADAIRLARNKHFQITDQALETIDGLLLGDGHLTPGKRGESYLVVNQAPERRDWLEIAAKSLNDVGIVTTIKPRKAGKPKVYNGVTVVNRGGWKLSSKSYVQLSEQRHRWYPGGEKRIPEDVRLTPRAVSLWYAGDGYSAQRRLGFCTNSFRKEDVDAVCGRLNEAYDLGAYVYMRAKGKKSETYRRYPVLLIANKQGAERLISLIDPTGFPRSMVYKLDLKGWAE